MPRGGRRSGSQGAAYSNRTDLNQAPRSTSSQNYGDRTRREDAQKVVPLPRQRRSPVRQQAPLPGEVTPLGAESMRPDEPLTAGVAIGPGPGPQMASSPGEKSDEVLIMRKLYAMYPNDDLRRFLERHDA